MARIGRPKTLKEPVTLGVRISAEQAVRLDAYTAAQERLIYASGKSFNRSDAVRLLIARGLDAWERARKL